MCPTINRHEVTFERNSAGASTKAACLCVTWYSVSLVIVWYRELVQEAHALCHLCGTGGSVGTGGRGGVSVSRLRLRKLLEYNHTWNTALYSTKLEI